MIEETQLERIKRFSKIFYKSRMDAGVSQEYIAAELRVSPRTVQNWEYGVSSPSFFQSTEWFRALGLNPLPYYFDYVYPNFEGVKSDDPDEKVKDLLMEIVATLTSDDMRRLLFLLYGNHGSSPHAVLNMITAHLQTPINDRVAQAAVILHNYEMEKEIGNIVRPNNIQPDIELLRDSIKSGKMAAVKDKKGYSTI